MKEIRIEVPNDRVIDIEKLIQTHSLNYSHGELLGDKHVFHVRVKAKYSNNFLHELRSRGVGEIFGHISVLQLSLYLSPEEDKSSLKTSSAANVEEIVANIRDNAVLSRTYLALVILAAILAAFGLLANSIVIIIGSMIVAPLLGPVALTSLGILVPGRDLLQKGLIAEIVGIGLTVATGFLVGITLGIDESQITEQMLERASQTNPIHNIIFAITSGLAAGLIISKGESLSMVGVAIAASLCPPAANIGLFLAFNDLYNANFAAILLLINLLAINASCSITFSIFRLPSKAGVSKRRVTQMLKNLRRITFLVVVAFFIISYLYLKQLGVNI